MGPPTARTKKKPKDWCYIKIWPNPLEKEPDQPDKVIKTDIREGIVVFAFVNVNEQLIFKRDE